MKNTIDEEIYGGNDEFDRIGMAKQLKARKFKESKTAFERSCMLCSMRKRQVDCEVCPIRKAFLKKWEGWKFLKAEDYIYVEEERASC